MLFIEAVLMNVPSILGPMLPGEGRPVWPVKPLLLSPESKSGGEFHYSGCPHQISPLVCVLTLVIGVENAVMLEMNVYSLIKFNMGGQHTYE